MKIALCNSGHLRTIDKVIDNQNKFLIEPNRCDIFVYTSDLVTQRKNSETYSNPITNIHYSEKYSKNTGMIYKSDKNDITNKIKKLYSNRLKYAFIADEKINDKNKTQDPSTWEFHRVRQFYKVLKCNELVHRYEQENNFKYDIIIRSRPDTKFLFKKINIKNIINSFKGNLNNSVFVFGGWPDPNGHAKSRIGFFDGFAFGVPSVMDIYSNVYFNKKVYANGGHPTDKENPGNQLEQYLIENGLKIVYIHGPARNKRQRGYITIR